MLRRSHIALLAALLVPGGSGAQQEETAMEMEPGKYDTAIFAGGCFWCVESDFDKIPGVLETVSGYTGGHKEDPTYEEVSAGGTGHAEAVRVVYDPTKIGYRELVEHFWRTVDPTTPNRQFCDSGAQYRTAIFYNSPEQQEIAERSRAELERSKPFAAAIVTEIAPATQFYPAEDYHQNYYKKNPLRYNYYRLSCGRDRRLEELWGSAGRA